MGWAQNIHFPPIPVRLDCDRTHPRPEWKRMDPIHERIRELCIRNRYSLAMIFPTPILLFEHVNFPFHGLILIMSHSVMRSSMLYLKGSRTIFQPLRLEESKEALKCLPNFLFCLPKICNWLLDFFFCLASFCLISFLKCLPFFLKLLPVS